VSNSSVLPITCLRNYDFLLVIYSNLYYRQDAAKRQAGIKFTHRPKNQVIRPAEATRCTDSSQTWQGRRPRGSAWLCKISPQWPRGKVGMRPQNIKNFHFLVKSRPVGATPLTDFEFFYGLLYV